MAETTLEKIVLRLSCQLFLAERDRDKWAAAATLCDQQHDLCKQTLATAIRDGMKKEEQINNLQGRLNALESQINKMDFKLRSICLSAITAKANLRAEGKASGFVDATLKALQEAAGTQCEDALSLHDWKQDDAIPPPAKFAAYWDDTTSESEQDDSIESV